MSRPAHLARSCFQRQHPKRRQLCSSTIRTSCIKLNFSTCGRLKPLAVNLTEPLLCCSLRQKVHISWFTLRCPSVRRVVEPRTRRVVLANLLKCAADQQAACREFDTWMEKNKRFFITQEERLNKLFHLRVAEPRGLRKVCAVAYDLLMMHMVPILGSFDFVLKFRRHCTRGHCPWTSSHRKLHGVHRTAFASFAQLQHLLMRAEQCGLVERSKSMGYRRAAPSADEDFKPCDCQLQAQSEHANRVSGRETAVLAFDGRGLRSYQYFVHFFNLPGLFDCAARITASTKGLGEGDSSLNSQLLFGPDDSQYSQEASSEDESHSITWNESSTKGWAALKRSGTSRSTLNPTGFAGLWNLLCIPPSVHRRSSCSSSPSVLRYSY